MIKNKTIKECCLCGSQIKKGEFSRIEGRSVHKECIAKRKERKKRLKLRPELYISSLELLSFNRRSLDGGRVIRKPIGDNKNY